MRKVRWQGGYEKKAKQEEGEMSENRLIELLDDLATMDDHYLWSDDWEVMLKEIKEIVIDHHDLIERLRNINFPVEKRRKK